MRGAAFRGLDAALSPACNTSVPEARLISLASSCYADTKDSSCIPCTGLPPNAKYASAGIPYNADACIWLCSKGFWRDVTLATTPTGGECTPCTTAPCPIGFTRSPCLSSADSECIPCNNTKPVRAAHVSDDLFANDAFDWPRFYDISHEAPLA